MNHIVIYGSNTNPLTIPAIWIDRGHGVSFGICAAFTCVNGDGWDLVKEIEGVEVGEDEEDVVFMVRDGCLGCNCCCHIRRDTTVIDRVLPIELHVVIQLLLLLLLLLILLIIIDIDGREYNAVILAVADVVGLATRVEHASSRLST
jgi:hypothetical protein